LGWRRHAAARIVDTACYRSNLPCAAQCFFRLSCCFPVTVALNRTAAHQKLIIFA
jgi:hypothetical protein